MAGSYYKVIEGKKYKRVLLAAAAEASKGAGDGRISQSDAEKLIKLVKDGDTYTDVEKDTVKYVREKFNWTESANEWFRTEIRKWAATKVAKKSEEKKDLPKAEEKKEG
jgi:hypothetical protein